MEKTRRGREEDRGGEDGNGNAWFPLSRNGPSEECRRLRSGSGLRDSGNIRGRSRESQSRRPIRSEVAAGAKRRGDDGEQQQQQHDDAALLPPPPPPPPPNPHLLLQRRSSSPSPPPTRLLPQPIRSRKRSSSSSAVAGWFSMGFGAKKKSGQLPEIVKAGDPVLHEPAQEVAAADIGSEKLERIIDDMIAVMRNAPGVGLAAPQIGIPLKIIVLEDTKEYISYAPKKEIGAQDRRPLIFCFSETGHSEPKASKRSNKTALFFEGCLSVDGFRAVVERHLEVEVSGLSRDGRPIKIEASGWQARILQHECDHLDGTLYVDKMVPRTFRTVENLDLPLATVAKSCDEQKKLQSLPKELKEGKKFNELWTLLKLSFIASHCSMSYVFSVTCFAVVSLEQLVVAIDRIIRFEFVRL
uniref:Peptide deformylase n=1 Tax=Ananas comosus var. bracteatus TaxID=296719 RepID=A0A6V7NYT7_ANACO|nr:unnamed protein product [Ananas comosus var. bracteatus]